MSDQQKPMNSFLPTNGAKALTGIIMMVALIAGVYAMVEPMQQQIDFLQAEINTIRTAMERDDDRENLDVQKRAAMGEQFKEVETQFKAMSERIKAMEEFLLWYHRNVPQIHAERTIGQKELERRLEILEGWMFEVLKKPGN